MYVCRRSFRDMQGCVSAGSIVDPATIKRFRYRLQEGHIVEVNEQNFDKYASLFAQRYGVCLTMPDPVEPTPDETDPVEPDPDETDLVEPDPDETDLVEPDPDETATIKIPAKAISIK